MPNHFSITHAIRDSDYQIAAIVVSETPSGRKFVGGLAGTFVSTEMEECTEENFLSRLPLNTGDRVLALSPGAHTFDPERGEWS